MPPNGSLFFLNLLPIIDSLSNRSPSTMETEERLENEEEGMTYYVPSSMMSTFVLIHLEFAFLFLRTFDASSSALSIPSPIPAKEWIVTPPMLHAAIPEIRVFNNSRTKMYGYRPVDAVIATASGVVTCFFRRVLMISRRRTDLPVPRKIIRLVISQVKQVWYMRVQTDQHCQYRRHYAHL